ncbi:DegV family protein [Caldibacillus lycopersici]|uniref:DegV family protein n=1 Tax=Perspicuibacillus lycopersici TaxID=1325689 RepID=A0AAE3IVG9_9BACI|nr:DegV family protein [Perspicuibacillus lycopersici]MCU9613634.1 DegV family protein [Perspicuibacillus lycopersici]
MSIKIVTDSTADINKEMCERYQISVIPMQIILDGKTYIDRVDITPNEFLEKMKAADELPKSSQPSIGHFIELYDQLSADGSEIISIHLAGELSGTVRTAHAAALQCNGKVTVVDSTFISKALTFQVVEAAKMAQEGKTVEEIVNRLNHIRLRTKLYVVVNTFENLVKGGRIGKGKALIGSLLKIKPIASLEDGIYTPIANVRSYSQVVKNLVKHLKEDTDGKEIKEIGIVHADGMELATLLKEKILEAFEHLEILIEDTTPIISTHTGPGAIGFMYYAE